MRLSIHDLKAAIPPAEFFAAELPDMPPPRGAGWRDGGLCPFHEDHHRGSFRVNVDSGAFRCFACGARGGDVLAFLMMRDGLTFPEALRELADQWGLYV
jgi:DNA primase